MSTRRGDGYAKYSSMGGDKQTYQPNDNEIILSKIGELDLFLNESVNNLCVLYIYAKWCGPCKVIGPKFFELSKVLQDKNITLRKIDGENEICGERGIRKMFNAFPTFLFFKGGQLIDKMVGGDFEGLCNKINKHAATKS